MIWLEIDPNVVKPGWTPLMITVGLGIAVVLLYLSMRRQFRRINVPDDAVEAVESEGIDVVAGSEPAAPPNSAPTSPAAPSAQTAPTAPPAAEKG